MIQSIFKKRPLQSDSQMAEGLQQLEAFLFQLGNGHTDVKVPDLSRYEHFEGIESALRQLTPVVQTAQAGMDLLALQAKIEVLLDLLSTSQEIGAQLLSSTHDTIAHANFASAKGNEISERNLALATSIEQMGDGIKEVAQQTTTSAGVVSKAQGFTKEAVEHIQMLGNSTNEIGDIVKVIQRVADQTNLLALNATIEAARAGEMGKGFAVVAAEVKELARTTAASTVSIHAKINAIQKNTQTAVSFIQKISSIIDNLQDISRHIATSVEEQAYVSREIALHANDTATDSTQITSKMQEVEGYNQVAAEIIEALQQSNREMLTMASELKNLVKQA